jgi:anti-sigma regulatory factor (Ser/Thr protein kinase)
VGRPADEVTLSEPCLVRFGAEDLRLVRQMAARWAAQAGMTEERADDFVIAVSEIATNAVRHGSPQAMLWLCTEGQDVVLAEIRDRGRWATPGLAEAGAGGRGRMGLALARRVCDEVDIRAGSNGTTVRLRMSLSG